MTDFIAYIAPPGAVVDPPVHPETRVQVIYSDGDVGSTDWPAAEINWSSEGDGPRVVAYRVVEEYTPPKVPREWWIVGDCEAWRSKLLAEFNRPAGASIIHVREVLE
jgi:hypothetical protein